MGIKHSFTSSKSDGADATKVKPSDWNDDHEIDGDVDFDGHAVTNLEDEAYNQAAWDGNLSAPTKNALRDKIEALVLTGGGVTDFLALDDTPDAYTGFDGENLPRLGTGATLQVNAAGTAVEFKYSTADYIDIRDYGTVTDGGDIGAALQATFDALTAIGGAFTAAQRIRIPKVGSGTYTCAAVTFPTAAIVLEIDAQVITVANTWSLSTGQTIRGLQSGGPNVVMPYGPEIKPRIIAGSGAADPVMEIVNKPNIRIEHVHLDGGTGVALEMHKADLCTVSHCQFTSTASTPFIMDSCFWMQCDHIYCDSQGFEYSAIFSTDQNWGTSNGLVLCKDWIVTGNGILFRSVFGHVDNTYIDQLHSESMAAGNALINFDSTVLQIGGIYLKDMGNSDALGTVYLIKNTGYQTYGVVVEHFNDDSMIHPSSTPIGDFVIDVRRSDSYSNQSMPPSLTGLYSGTPFSSAHTLVTSGGIDTRLMTSPVGLPWTLVTPLNVPQDPASWTPLSAGIVTTGKQAPDGSLLAAELSNGGAYVYSVNHTLAVGDMFLAGVWMKNPDTTDEIFDQGTWVELFASSGSAKINQGGAQGTLNQTLDDRIIGNGWQWQCRAFTVTQIGTNPHGVRFALSSFGTSFTRWYFNPCLMLIPAATVALYGNTWIEQMARSMKGGWSPTNVQGDVGVLDHQAFKAGVFKATAKTFATLPSSPVAGMMAYITNSNTATWGATAAGGGANKVMVWYNGTNWTVMGA